MEMRKMTSPCLRRVEVERSLERLLLPLVLECTPCRVRPTPAMGMVGGRSWCSRGSSLCLRR